ncbi:acyl-CoA synthetase family member 3 [Hibiscus syriacus]|uniref:Acyl-CoA synthetase family member 3 n=1 Tax=Hibiscus syriacus TaxID=106335 RepID=A0A6A2Y1L4_HIBSY|nr:acyl-CoA synthetase family member 3 [Hibiscus syriacus]
MEADSLQTSLTWLHGDVDGNWHVGALASLLDLLGGVAIFSVANRIISSVDFNVSYYRTAKIQKHVEIESKVTANRGKLWLKLREKETDRHLEFEGSQQYDSFIVAKQLVFALATFSQARFLCTFCSKMDQSAANDYFYQTHFEPEDELTRKLAIKAKRNAVLSRHLEA